MKEKKRNKFIIPVKSTYLLIPVKSAYLSEYRTIPLIGNALAKIFPMRSEIIVKKRKVKAKA